MTDRKVALSWLGGSISLERLAELLGVNSFELYAQLSNGKSPLTIDDVCKAIEAARRPQ